jgi:hypothetical protein
MPPREAVKWLAAIAEEPARRQADGRTRVRNGYQALRGVLRGRPLPERQAPDALYLLVLAEREATLFGPQGVALARCSIDALADLAAEAKRRRCPTERRNVPELRIGGYRIRPNLRFLSALGRIGGRVGGRVAVAALRAKLAELGVTPALLGEAERELGREGLSLGAMATPAPIAGTLAAMAPDALAGRWLASRLG